jgi:hypothetical protein
VCVSSSRGISESGRSDGNVVDDEQDSMSVTGDCSRVFLYSAGYSIGLDWF